MRRRQAVPTSRGANAPLGIAAITLVLVVALSYGLPANLAASGVGLAFLAATYWGGLRGDAASIARNGLSLGGILEPEPLEWRRMLRESTRALAGCTGVAILTFPGFWLGFRAWWHITVPFVWHPPASYSDEVFGQLLVIALPEEAFFRGYLQSSLTRRWGTPWKVLGAPLGWGWIASSAIFAAGHLLTEPNPARLGVFFPALLFGWMRARSGGIGVGVLYHAACNLFSASLSRGYGMQGG